jgi:signal peptidase II
MIFYIIAIIVVLLDQITKIAIISYAQSHEVIFGRSLMSWFGMLDIVFTTNPGAAFGIFPDQRWIFIGISILASIGIIVYVTKYKALITKWSHIGFALILGGAVGNLIDRIFRIEVVDFIDVHFGSYHWPAFNVADSAIFVGVGLVIIELFIKTGTQKSKTRSQNTEVKS